MNAIGRAISAVMGSPAKDGSRRMRAEWNGVTLAQSDKTVVVEGNHYFPPEALNRAFFDHSDRRSVCPWKGTADYYDVVVDGKRNAAAAWTYPTPNPAAEDIRGHFAFWKGVKVSEAEPDVG